MVQKEKKMLRSLVREGIFIKIFLLISGEIYDNPVSGIVFFNYLSLRQLC